MTDNSYFTLRPVRGRKRDEFVVNSLSIMDLQIRDGMVEIYIQDHKNTGWVRLTWETAKPIVVWWRRG
jgi:hypothetical protein